MAWLRRHLLLFAAVAVLCWRGMRKGTLLPFVAAIAIFLLAFLGLVGSNVPYIVPPTMTEGL